MKYVGYYNGEIGPYEEMSIPMSDRSIYFGDGCYDATTFCNHHIFALNDHLDRFYSSCKLLEIDFDMSREELDAELMKGTESLKSGKTYTADEVDAELAKNFGI